jgi:MOSC domain-containing protein YiiM
MWRTRPRVPCRDSLDTRLGHRQPASAEVPTRHAEVRAPHCCPDEGVRPTPGITIRAVVLSIVQINVSKGGVPKLPIAEAVVTRLGIEGDDHAHPEVHGGPRQALLWICEEAIEELKTLGYPLYAGALGENLTSRGVDRRALRIGQRWRAGGVVMELTKIRTPCQTIQVYGPDIGPAIYDQKVNSGDWTSPRWGLSGFYASVVQPGRIRAGDSLELLDTFLDTRLETVA